MKCHFFSISALINKTKSGSEKKSAFFFLFSSLFRYNKDMKNKAFQIGLLSLSLLFATASCAADNYSVYKGSERRLNLTVSDTFKASYQSGDKISFEGLTVTFDSETLSSSQYYLTFEPSHPRENKINEGDEVSTSGNNNNISLYAAYDVGEVTYVSSQSASITATSSKSVNPWVYYVCMGVVIVALGVWLFLRNKAKKEGRA